MSSNDPYIFRVFVDQRPGLVDTWRQGPSSAEWHRHYLLSPGTSLSVVRAERVDLIRNRSLDGFRVQDTILSSAFPLDWMGLMCITTALPHGLSDLPIDGSNPQAFVDSLAVPELPQASVLKEIRTAYQGSVIARTTRLTVPAWRASGLSFALTGMQSAVLRSLIASAGLSGAQHTDLDDWLRSARRSAGAEAAAGGVSDARTASAFRGDSSRSQAVG